MYLELEYKINRLISKCKKSQKSHQHLNKYSVKCLYGTVRKVSLTLDTRVTDIESDNCIENL